MAGWVKFHRKILDNPIFLKPDLYQLFSYCLLRANHNETKIIWNGAEETLDKGCFITGRKAIAADTGQTESAIYRKLKVLENLKMISVKSNNKYSVVKVLNYCIYQGTDIETEQPVNNQRTTTEQPVNTDKNVKNEKNEKKVINSIPKIKFAESVKLTEIEHAKLITQYGEEDTKRLINILDNYKLSSGKKYKSDYHTIIGWVAKRLAEEKQRGGGQAKPIPRAFSSLQDWANGE